MNGAVCQCQKYYFASSCTFTHITSDRGMTEFSTMWLNMIAKMATLQNWKARSHTKIYKNEIKQRGDQNMSKISEKCKYGIKLKVITSAK